MDWRQVMIFWLTLLQKIQNISTQTNEFVRNCNDPLIVAHDATFSHTYCFHACGFSNAGMPTCAAAGYCLCGCSPTAPPVTWDSDLCPPGPTEAADPDPQALSTCMAMCAAGCAGGQGQICSEVAVFVNPATGNNIYAKVCTCICPPSSCTFTEPTTTTTTSTTTQAPSTSTTMIAPSTSPTTVVPSTSTTALAIASTTQISVAFFPVKVPVLKPKILTKTILILIIIFEMIVKILLLKLMFTFASFYYPAVMYVYNWIQMRL